MRITNLVNHFNAPNDAEIELKPHTSHIKFFYVNNENKFSVVIFVDLVVVQKDRFLQHENKLDSNSFENIVDKKFKLHAYCFFLLILIKILQKLQKYVFLFLFIKIKMSKLEKWYKLTCTL